MSGVGQRLQGAIGRNGGSGWAVLRERLEVERDGEGGHGDVMGDGWEEGEGQRCGEELVDA